MTQNRKRQTKKHMLVSGFMRVSSLGRLARGRAAGAPGQACRRSSWVGRRGKGAIVCRHVLSTRYRLVLHEYDTIRYDNKPVQPFLFIALPQGMLGRVKGHMFLLRLYGNIAQL